MSPTEWSGSFSARVVQSHDRRSSILATLLGRLLEWSRTMPRDEETLERRDAGRTRSVQTTAFHSARGVS
jgi:hypothetical protein